MGHLAAIGSLNASLSYSIYIIKNIGHVNLYKQVYEVDTEILTVETTLDMNESILERIVINLELVKAKLGSHITVHD